MESTKEQIAIINTNEDIKVNATAGSGKTTTLINYVKEKDRNKTFLYAVFNKSVKLEAIEKFKAEGLNNVTVETAHSLAYNEIIRHRGYKLAVIEYKPFDLITRFKINELTNKPLMDTHNFIIAYHLKTIMSFYCNSDVVKFSELKYEEVLDATPRSVYLANKNIIDNLFKAYWVAMDNRQMAVTHEFYLKKFQLVNPKLNYDYILLDEGQDSSGVMLSIFSKQTHAIRLIVGDDNQQIYSWRYAINALSKVDVPTYPLSVNFRCNSTITHLAETVLDLKKLLVEDIELLPIVGAGTSTKTDVHAVIGRTNIGLLAKAIEYISTNRYDKVYFEGSFTSYTYSNDGSSLYDVLNLYLEQKDMIRDKMIQTFDTFDDLKEYVESVTDPQLNMFINIVENYKKDIPKYIKRIKSCICETKAEAEVIFTTASRSKGIEYDTVEIVPDFITENSILKTIEDNVTTDVEERQPIPIPKIIEEINLLYVACTRAKNILYIPESLVPSSMKMMNEHIYLLDNDPELVFESHPWTEYELDILKRTSSMPYLKKILKRSSKRIKNKKIELGLIKNNHILDK